MKRWKNALWIAAATLGLTALISSVSPDPLAQVRAALVRDVDTPALQPFRASVEYSLAFINDQRLITTVPAGKRLVIDYISWTATNPTGQQLVFAGLRTSQFGTFVSHLQVNPPHISATGALVLQDGSLPVQIYFEPGEEVWISASKSAGGFSTFQIDVHGHFVTL
jgi:hypothetical protein